MSLELYEFGKLGAKQRLDVASAISLETFDRHKEGQQIVPVEAEEILQRKIGLVALVGDKIAGYVSAKKPQERFAQISTLVVLEESQGIGVGSKLVQHVTDWVLDDDLKPFAFCSPCGQRSFVKSNYIVAEPQEMPTNITSKFSNQPMIHHVNWS